MAHKPYPRSSGRCSLILLIHTCESWDKLAQSYTAGFGAKDGRVCRTGKSWRGTGPHGERENVRYTASRPGVSRLAHWIFSRTGLFGWSWTGIFRDDCEELCARCNETRSSLVYSRVVGTKAGRGRTGVLSARSDLLASILFANPGECQMRQR